MQREYGPAQALGFCIVIITFAADNLAEYVIAGHSALLCLDIEEAPDKIGAAREVYDHGREEGFSLRPVVSETLRQKGSVPRDERR